MKVQTTRGVLVKDPRQELIELLAGRAYRQGEFKLASGRTSNFYLDSKQVTYYPAAVDVVGEVFFKVISGYQVIAVGGLTMGADPIVAATAAASFRAGGPIDGFVVRKEPKAHGLHKNIEGIVPKAGRVALVDDVITSGESVLRAAKAVREIGLEVAIIVGLVDREEGGRQNVENQGFAFASICTLSEIRQYAEENQLSKNSYQLI